MSVADLNKFEQFFTKYEENGFIANSNAFPLFVKCKLDENVINNMYAREERRGSFLVCIW